MPKDYGGKFYAVLNGRGGPRICGREEYRTATFHFSGASGKSFFAFEDAQRWLDERVNRQNHSTVSVVIRTEHQQKNTSTMDLNELTRYPTSTRYWADYKRASHVDVAVQCPDPSTSLDLTAATPKHVVGSTVPESDPRPIKPPEPLAPELSSEQLQVLNLVLSGRSVFFTGPAGTGKSVLLREIIRVLKSKIMEVAITAPTGIAGVNIGGQTIHSFAGIGLGKEAADMLATKISHSKRLKIRWKSTQVLVIDEISMMDALLFDKLEYIARHVRGNPKPFGGIQLVLSGDFFQLPPVPDQSHQHRMAATYAFDASSWSTCISKPIFLTQVFRQKDNAFIDILTSMRSGVLTAQHIQQLQKLSRPLHYSDGVEPSQLFPLRRDVEGCNNSRLKALEGQEHVYVSMDSAGYDVRHMPISIESANLLLDRLVAVSIITLKIGAQVMLIQNIEQKVLVNGSVGKVVEFLTTREAMDRHIRIATLPVHQNDSPPDFKPELLDLKPLPPSDLRPFNNHSFGARERWPMVRFLNGRELLCAPLAFTVEGYIGNVEAHRLQVPLILAWALSIHKSQGQTLERVKVDLGHTFEKGQAYVALSRAVSMDGLEIQNFQPSKVMAHPRVIEWQKCWTSQDERAPFDEMDSEEAISSWWQLDLNEAPGS